MASLQQIIDYLNRKYPDHGETNANIVLDLEDIHKDVFMRLQRLMNTYDIYESTTVLLPDGTGQLNYALPSNARVEDVIKVLVSTDTTGSEFEEFEYAGLNDDISDGKYYGRGSDEDSFFIAEDDEPIATAGLKIHAYYYKRPAALSSSNLSQIPELDVDYHDLLKFGIIQAMAAQGPNPDEDIANYWQAKFDEKMAYIEKSLKSRYNRAPLRIATVKEWW